MAKLFIKQAKQYADYRPNYPPQLFQYIASKTPNHDLVWDAGTGSGQAAQHLAAIYSQVIATDTSPKQIEFATRLSNIRYHVTSPTMSMSELQHNISAESTLDLVTVAQAMHWFDLPSFYTQVKHVLKKPHGVLATWCYTAPEVNDAVDAVFNPFYTVKAGPYWEPPRKLVDDEYRSIEFPFEPVDGESHTGPFRFMIEKVMGLDDFLMYLRSWSAYQTAKDEGVELLSDDVVKDFTRAWNESGGGEKKVVRYPIYLRIGKVGN